MSEYVVVAFGGNAMLPSGQPRTADGQRVNIERMGVELARLVLGGQRVVVTHGNGPQVGEIMLRSDLAREVAPPTSLEVAVAMSQGEIGYQLQQAIAGCLNEFGVSVPVVSLITQVIVEKVDPAFRCPTKPIGRFYSQEEAQRLEAEWNWRLVEDAGRGYRRVVPSPQPRSIVEWRAVRALLDAGTLVIAGGGGGIPVTVDADGRLRGVEAVIDKDRVAERLAVLVGAHTLVLLTEVSAVAIHYGTAEQRPLGTVSLDELKGLAAAGHFPAGSMGPKVESAIRFLDAGGERAIITSPEHLVAAVHDGSVGTQVRRMAVSKWTQP